MPGSSHWHSLHERIHAAVVFYKLKSLRDSTSIICSVLIMKEFTTIGISMNRL